MRVCPSCGRENADDARFCSHCATPLQAETSAREERKVVTCLFCDLVGFTARAESMDPEDVRRLLQPYHARVRAELERFSGTVEKFVGDAVMAVFGAPVAHEDDPERAVRAALAIRDALADTDLEIHIGVTTGEALITLDARADAGEGIAAGDVVNTAARIQAAAPSGQVLVDETTFRATERVIELEQAAAIEAKGKAQPVRVWQAVRARSRVGVERLSSTPFVGRDYELTLLQQSLARAIDERGPRLLTLVGVPGIGKSRLVYELFRAVESGGFGLVYWRHGRSLPYGDGVTFWALAEIVKAQAGILESDSIGQAADKLHRSVETPVSDASDASWIERHLRPLVGLDADAGAPAGTTGESFAAWRRFLESLAESRPLVLVFEDLHWADDALLDFVDYLVDWARGVPLLALCTARPELLVRRPEWGGGKVNSSTILLSALTEAETSELIDSLLTDAALDRDTHAQVIERSSGNPLYAEEFVRLATARAAGAALPETVQGIIAARLDMLPQEEKELLQEAAVIGRVFWLGALGRERWTLEARLHSLERQEFVTRERTSAVAGESEYVFRHALVRDVAYEQIPKAARAGKHLATAEWIESLGRADDHSELLAHHYAAALDYARASGQDQLQLAERGRLALREAGDRALALNAFAAAARYYTLAVQLWPEDDDELPVLLFRLARARHVSGDERREESLEIAHESLLASGRAEEAAEVDAMLAEVWWYRRNRDQCDAFLARAAAGVANLPDSPAKAFVLSQVARYRMLANENDEVLLIGRQALEMAERLDLDELQAHALDNIGVARVALGDQRGVADLERSVQLALALRSPEAARALNNLGAIHSGWGDFRRAEALFAEASRVGEELGAPAIARFSAAQLVGTMFWTGKWDEALGLAESWLSHEDGEEGTQAEHGLRRNRARVLLARDDVEGALEDVSRGLHGGGLMRGEPQGTLPALGVAIRVYLELGREREAAELARELLELARRSFDWRIYDFTFAAEQLGHADELSSLFETTPPSRWRDANLALLVGKYADSAAIFEDGGVVFAAADARKLAAAKLASAGRRDEAEEQIERALGFYRAVRAVRYVRECEALRRSLQVPA